MARSRRRRSSPSQPRDLHEAAARVAERFAGIALRSPQDGCGHCFDENELVLLATPDVPLDRDLAMRAAWKVHQFDDMDGLMRRVLPSMAAAVVDGEYDMGRALRGLAVARFQEWPPSMTGPVLDLLDMWFRTTLRTPGASAMVVLEECAAALNAVGRWLAMWEREETAIADAQLAEAAYWWASEPAPHLTSWLLSPDDVDVELRAWVAGYAAGRLAAYGAPPEVVRRLRRLGTPPGEGPGDHEWVTLPPPSEWRGVRQALCR